MPSAAAAGTLFAANLPPNYLSGNASGFYAVPPVGGRLYRPGMEFEDHVRLISHALKDWFLARLYDSLAVGVMWWLGLHLMQVPLAWLWAFLAALLQFIPHLGPALALIGPAAAGALGGEERFLLVLILYVVITVVNGLVLEPLFFRRVAHIPIWATLLVPVVLGLIFSFWGVVFAAPLLAVYYAYWRHASSSRTI